MYTKALKYVLDDPASWDCRMHQQHFCRGVRLPQWVSWYDTKQSDGEDALILELWGMQSTPWLSSLLGPLWPWMGAPDRVLSMGKIEQNSIFRLNWVVWNRTFYMYKNGFGIK